eukprot:CAMPEP_0175934228 /NCGR_PEP_ID=MMETSP0108-20121206/20373_1 /TAXON_ID=195067 ORGANISM="Goniomonas pacifica, Strain CCMP1869" /NCGR_SAMPLE_ID=MMETSP0108 /ASSEMBLY_ACC=CAM_ASM_000204 /LENGTH=274 /DNA_ID=CAMNT_0017258043 /DNA_START=152 /DNA_END=977 /DNA_ORIENTATION=-
MTVLLRTLPRSSLSSDWHTLRLGHFRACCMCSIVGPIILVPKCDRGVLRDLASGGARNTSPSARHVATCPCVLRPSHTTASKIGRCSCLGHIIAPSHLGSLRSTTSNYNAVGRGSDAPKIDHRPGRRLHHGAAMEGLGGRSDDASDAWDSSAGAAILESSSNVFLAGCYASLLAIGSWEVGQAVYRDYGWELPEDTSQQFSIIVGILTLSPFCVGCAFAMHAQFGSRMFGTWSVGRLFTAPKTVEFSCDLTELDGWEPAPSQEGGTQDDSLVVC